MAESLNRNLAPEVVQGLNEELEVIRGLYVPKETALDGLYKAVQRIQEDFEVARNTGEIPEREQTAEDQLVEAARSMPAILERRAAFGTQTHSFMEKLHGLITTKRDGKPIKGSINPLFVDSPHDPARNYTGDKPGLPRVYITAAGIEGRVVDTQGQQPSAALPSVWVWPTGVKLGKWGDWHTGRGGSPLETVSLLDASVEFVEHVPKCKLPNPAQRDRQYSLTMD